MRKCERCGIEKLCLRKAGICNSCMGLRANPPLSLSQSFWAKVDRNLPTSECWPWLGTRNGNGYGIIDNATHGLWRAHRLSLHLHGVDVPKDKIVMHSCDHPWCVNPAHLSVATRLENNRDAQAKGISGNWNRMKTHCKYGHEFTPENTIYQKNGQRNCRTCRRALDRQRRRRRIQ